MHQKLILDLVWEHYGIPCQVRVLMEIHVNRFKSMTSNNTIEIIENQLKPMNIQDSLPHAPETHSR